MGVTIIVALCVWVAGSLVEYRIISKIPAMEKVFHGVPGMIISIGIGASMGFLLGASSGAGFILGQTIGLATNDMTFAMWTGLHNLAQWAKEMQVKVKLFIEVNKARFEAARETIVMGGRAIIKFIYAILWLFALPAKANKWINQHRKVPT